LALIIHCFNPLVWLSFVLMTKDMEMSCDEAVVKEMGSEIKKEYSMSLLSFATDKKGIGMAPIAFGEGEVKSRVKNILNYKKPRFWIVIISAVALIAIAMGLIFNPVNNEEDNKYLDINKVLEEIFITDEVIIRRVGEGGYILGGETFSEDFKAKIKDLKEHK
ncbi:antirepressor regulating drug resistance protein, partial [Clostridium saudiense]|nr:antirepressor regulating drug resistance protein [Clostridium saudiense]